MTEVNLRRLGPGDWASVLTLRAAPEQQHLIATVEKSLAEVDVNPALTAFAIYDGSQLGLPDPKAPPVGFAVTEVVASVGFILRLLIGEQHQHQGYGRASMVELVRRLRMDPDVQMVATSHRADNAGMERMCAALGFVPWHTPFDPPDGEVYLRLPS
ncbi:GNAT family N-acetyltransferase [Nocardioides taihuensis]|uniref:GNAT family N-acetyltransferase n=1 Tax=Nocardioides taihuensis TaxID=1835606 RepID=A0ABW0BLC9_9ACTN